jgi:PAS domain-containing protein
MAEQVAAARDALQQGGDGDRPAQLPRLPGAAIWHWDLATGSVEWDEGLAILFGYREGITDAAWRRALIHPGDRDRVEISLQRATIRNDGLAWSEQYRLHRPDGSYTQVSERAFVLHDDAGPRCAVGAITPSSGGEALAPAPGAIQPRTARPRAAASRRRSE